MSRLSCDEDFNWDLINGMRNLREVLVTDCGLNLEGWILGKLSVSRGRARSRQNLTTNVFRHAPAPAMLDAERSAAGSRPWTGHNATAGHCLLAGDET